MDITIKKQCKIKYLFLFLQGLFVLINKNKAKTNKEEIKQVNKQEKQTEKNYHKKKEIFHIFEKEGKKPQKISKDILVSNQRALGGINKQKFNLSFSKDLASVIKSPKKQLKVVQGKQHQLFKNNQKLNPSRAILSFPKKIILSPQIIYCNSSSSNSFSRTRGLREEQLIKYKEKKQGVQLNFILFCERRRRKRILIQQKKESKQLIQLNSNNSHFLTSKSSPNLKPNSSSLSQRFSQQSKILAKSIDSASAFSITKQQHRDSSSQSQLALAQQIQNLPSAQSLLPTYPSQITSQHKPSSLPKTPTFADIADIPREYKSRQLKHSLEQHKILIKTKPLLNMEDETQFLQQHQLLRDNQFAFGAGASCQSGYGNSPQQRAYGLKGLELKKKHRFPFNVTSFESVGKKVVLGSDVGNLYAYQVVQSEQKQTFKLLYFESNAHPRSQIHKLVRVEQNKKTNSKNGISQKNQQSGLIQNLDEINCNNASSLQGQSASQNQGFNFFSPNANNIQQQSNRSRKQSNETTIQSQGSIISCGFYDRKLILWEMSNRFEKKAQSQMFKTIIYNLAIDENYVYVGTFKKIYALSLVNNLTVCMKFGVPNYHDIDFQITSVACLPLSNSSILIAGTDSYKGINNFISLWEHPKECNIIQDEINNQIDEEEEENAAFNNQQAAVNDIEDLDNFDLDGDFNDTPTEAPIKKKKRLSFWRPSLLEQCHQSRIRQLKCFQNCPQFISVSITEINIWKIVEGAQPQIQSQQQFSYSNQLPQQISNNFSNLSPNQTAPMSLKQLNEMPVAQQVFSLQFNKERKIQTNAIIEKQTNNILMFVDSEVLSFDSTNFSLNYHQNLHSQNLTSLLYLNASMSSQYSYNNNDEMGKSSFIHTHNNHYVLVNNPQNTNLNAQFATKYTIAACEFEQSRRCKIESIQQDYLPSQNSIFNSYYQQQSSNLNQFNNSSSSESLIQPIDESRIEEEEEEIPKSPKLTPRSKKHIQSPIMKSLSQIPTSVPPVQKYSTAHIIPSTASYTILMNKLKQIEQTSNAARQLNSSSNSLRRPSQSAANIPAITFRKPFSGQPRSNSKCIKKQLKRYVKYSNKKKKMKQSLVKVFANQNNSILQKKDINPQSLTLIQPADPAPSLNQNEFTHNQQQLNLNSMQSNTQTYLYESSQAMTNLKSMDHMQINNNANKISTTNKNNKHQPQKTFLIVQDSEISLGFYTIQ